MNARLAQDREYWTQRASVTEEQKIEEKRKLMRTLERFQKEMARELFGFSLSTYPIKDMEFWGDIEK